MMRGKIAWLFGGRGGLRLVVAVGLVAIGYADGAASGGTPHEDVEGGVADDYGFGGWNLEPVEDALDGFRVWLGVGDVVGTDDAADEVGEVEAVDEGFEGGAAPAAASAAAKNGRGTLSRDSSFYNPNRSFG